MAASPLYRRAQCVSRPTCVCVCACVRACVRACVLASGRRVVCCVCMRTCVHVCTYVHVCIVYIRAYNTIQYNRTLLSRKREICVQRSSKS